MRQPRFFLIVVTMLISVVYVGQLPAQEPLPKTVTFNRDIRPILSDKCFHCHGPDKSKRKGDLRLDLEENAFADLGGYRALGAGNLEKSELYQRIVSTDADEQMPPKDAPRALSKRDIALIRRWIEQGAKWQRHWSFVPIARPTLPKPKNANSVRNPIDTFVLSRLETEGLTLSPAATKTALIRRVTLDLTGLPPTLAESDAFLADNSPKAYEKVVDRLLKSPRYGERMAVEWLDAARYADTSGYQSDGPRHMWRWRDWVIDAFNTNKPFDQFTIEQLAGDLLPNATLDQRIATGFNRNHRGNAEGGVIPEEFAVEYVVDRVETTSTVWLGLTMGCVRCHEHKYDPIAHEEFYKLYAFFNNLPENGRALKEGNSPPYIKAPTKTQQAKLKALDAQLAKAEQTHRAMLPEVAKAQASWFARVRLSRKANWTVTDGLTAHYSLDGGVKNSIPKKKTPPKKVATKKDKDFISPAQTFKDGQPKFDVGRLGNAAEFDGKRFVEVGDVGDFDYFDKFSLAAWVQPVGNKGGVFLSRMNDVNRGDGYSLRLRNGRLEVNLVKRWLDDSLRVATKRTFEPGNWYHIAVTYDGSRVPRGIRVFVNGEAMKTTVGNDFINQSFAAKAPLRIGGGAGPQGRFHGMVDDARLFDRRLESKEVAMLSVPETIAEIVSTPAKKQSRKQRDKLRAYFLKNGASSAMRDAQRNAIALRRQRQKFYESISTVMVMEELPTPRPTHVLLRGEYDKPGKAVGRGVPASLPPLAKNAPQNRLGLAQWLVDPRHPLTARVTVNRFWQQYFGVGIVKTSEDFGTQGDPPSHPKLLDWLSGEFIRGGWNVKALQKLIVMSATYRQSSKVTPTLAERDPENRLLARGPRFRLSAEVVRDQALAIGGLLVERLGGPSVKPYQPAGLWIEIASGGAYEQDHGDNLYRRTMYTFFKRTVAPPSMAAFDAAGREACQVRRARTNTPLQALALLNDVTYVEASRKLAERMMADGGKSAASRLTHGFRLVTGRQPKAIELQILSSGLTKHRQTYLEDAAAALKLVSLGESPRNKALNVPELAAYTAIAGLLFNLDEAVTKE
jgi:hypothetical protein